MSTFDPAAFEQMTIDQANETKSTPVPEGDYTALISKVRVKTVDIKNGARAGQTVPILEVNYQIQDDTGKLAEELNRDEVHVRQDIWLDVNENGALAFGPNQNLGLGRLRDAVGFNKPGKAFSFPMLEGQGPVVIHVTVDTNAETGDSFNRVPRVSRPA